MTEPRYSLTQLAGLAGVTPRTVRYYIAQGLLPSVGQPGPGAKYGDAHLARLRLVRRLQREHLPLAEIRRRLASVDDAAVVALAEADAPAQPRAVAESALEYVHSLLRPAAARAAAPPPPSFAPRAFAPPPTAAPAPESRPIERAQWERIALVPDVELHVRRPLDRRLGRRVERLISIARDLLEED